jgi:hypothetical protein
MSIRTPLLLTPCRLLLTLTPSMRRRCQNRSLPLSATSASGSTPGFAIASSPIRSPPVCFVVNQSSRSRIGRKRRTARGERGSIALVTLSGGLRRKRRRGRRWGLRAEPFRTERSRRMRSADVARVARSHPTAAVGRASVRAICATAGCRAGTPSAMIAARKLIDREPIQSLRTSPEILMTPDKQAAPRISIARRQAGAHNRVGGVRTRGGAAARSSRQRRSARREAASNFVFRTGRRAGLGAGPERR